MLRQNSSDYILELPEESFSQENIVLSDKDKGYSLPPAEYVIQTGESKQCLIFFLYTVHMMFCSE